MASFKNFRLSFKRKAEGETPQASTKPPYALPRDVEAFLAERSHVTPPPANSVRTAEELAAIEVLAGYGGNNAPRPAPNLRVV